MTLDGKLTVTANNPGLWANDYAIVIKKRTDDARYGRFRLKVVNYKQDPKGMAVEVFDNLSMNTADARSVASVLKSEVALRHRGGGGRRHRSARRHGLVRRRRVPTPPNSPAARTAWCWRPERRPHFETALTAADAAARAASTCWTASTCSTCSACPARPRIAVCQSAEILSRPARLPDCRLRDGCHADDARRTGPPALTGNDAINAAFYFPWVNAPDPLQENRALIPAVRLRRGTLRAHRRHARRLEGAGRHRGQPHRRRWASRPC